MARTLDPSTTSVPVHGNYHGYYAKRPSSSDARLALLPESLFAGARVLDVGCNEGYVTCEIAQARGAHRVVGVDIDASLIAQAWKRRRTVWSLQEPTSLDDHARNTESPPCKKRRRAADAMDMDEDVDVDVQSRADYFPAALEHMLGPMPVPPTLTARNAHTFPHNLSFRAADWARGGIPEDTDGWDIVLALSISKWIHLNGGDDGLIAFFRRVYSVLQPGGTFVLEPQDWGSYAKARRMHPTLKENAKSLKIRPEGFEEVLREIGFTTVRHLGSTGEGGFQRPIDMYVKPT